MLIWDILEGNEDTRPLQNNSQTHFAVERKRARSMEPRGCRDLGAAACGRWRQIFTKARPAAGVLGSSRACHLIARFRNSPQMHTRCGVPRRDALARIPPRRATSSRKRGILEGIIHVSEHQSCKTKKPSSQRRLKGLGFVETVVPARQ